MGAQSQLLQVTSIITTTMIIICLSRIVRILTYPARLQISVAYVSDTSFRFHLYLISHVIFISSYHIISIFKIQTYFAKVLQKRKKTALLENYIFDIMIFDSARHAFLFHFALYQGLISRLTSLLPSLTEETKVSNRQTLS